MRMLDKDDASRRRPICHASSEQYHDDLARGPDATQCLEHPWFSGHSEARLPFRVITNRDVNIVEGLVFLFRFWPCLFFVAC